MSTRMLILLALLCGMAILVAFTVQSATPPVPPVPSAGVVGPLVAGTRDARHGAGRR